MTFVKIFTTGGSIDKLYSTRVSDFVVGEPQIKNILSEANVQLKYQVESLIKKDSLEITEKHRQTIFQRVKTEPNRLIIITHGTDTMVQTARKLAAIPDKVIILTGAMQPAAFKKTDAAFNIGCALAAVQTLANGVFIVMNGKIFKANQVKKNLELNRFEAV